MKELRNVQNASEAMRTLHDGMSDGTSEGPSRSRESDVWVSNEIRLRNSQRLHNDKVAKTTTWVIQ